ncbi:MAG: hypothetical protein HOD92_27185 [Deltaproteobacteria bacterium]|jgi:hypothetical protein|nr:hypothetical protein [Deltaproteobacteria bacterium]MBT4526889.1 hypothetical protein [Deltaproteobacteria bacterium]
MNELTGAQKGRVAIRTFKTIADSLILRGNYKPSGRTGQTLERALREISPEIYGSMNDPRSVELSGLEYVLDRLPKGIENCNRIILTAQEDLDHTTFEKIEPLKRRRISYKMNQHEICFVITRGVSEVYDLLTHLTFLNIESEKIYNRSHEEGNELSSVWKKLCEAVELDTEPAEKELDHLLWSTSILLGTTYQETRKIYENIEKNKREFNSNNGFFKLIAGLGKRVKQSKQYDEDALTIIFTPTFTDMVGHHVVSRNWANQVKQKLYDLNYHKRPIHIISANMHSVKNTLYAYAAQGNKLKSKSETSNLYQFISETKDSTDQITKIANQNGFTEIKDETGANINYQIIDSHALSKVTFHPSLNLDFNPENKDNPVILVMDYAFGAQAFELMDELLKPELNQEKLFPQNIVSISIVGKAGILPGEKGDIILATAHVIEGTANNYIVNNNLGKDDFDGSIDVYEGPIVTVLGTSLQNKDVLEKFQTTSWKAVGLEMEGGHYQRAISAAMIKNHISKDIKIRYAYYASDNPLKSGQTLASGSMGKEGIKPTYMITKLVLEKIISE